MSDKPIKRSNEIMPLSREHHYSLLFSWKIQRGLNNGTELTRIIKYVDYFLENNLRHHFDREEKILFNHFPNHPLVLRALNEHKEAMDMMAFLNTGKGSEEEKRVQLDKLATLIIDHVRMEERELFPDLERRLSPEDLKKAGDVLHEMTISSIQDNDYADEFWESKK